MHKVLGNFQNFWKASFMGLTLARIHIIMRGESQSLDIIHTEHTVCERCILYKMKFWRRIYFGKLRISTKLNTAKFSFITQCHVKYNSIHQYKVHQSLRKDWFAKLNCCQLFILNYSVFTRTEELSITVK